jgi:queuine tRNA-ribosyltransferase
MMAYLVVKSVDTPFSYVFSMKRFTLTQSEQSFRRGVLETPHGSLTTPFFMPDATRASVRGLTPEDLERVAIEALVVNTYHLFLQPGESLIREARGVHAFMDWSHPILSDSGGYQVYSLIHKNPELGKITEEGANFRSVLDGSKHLLTPERSIRVQFDLGVDMMVCLDDPRPNDAPDEDIIAAVDRTIRWAKRCREEYDRQIVARGLTEETRPLLFGVVQGGMIVAERKRCAEGLAAIGFDGYGFGGRHIGMEGEFLEEIVTATASFIPKESLRFALGIGTPKDIVRCYAAGWDMFDCVIPTREGRHGRLFLWQRDFAESVIARDPSADGDRGNPGVISAKPSLFGRATTERSHSIVDDQENFYSTINIFNEQFTRDFSPVDSTCDCTLCSRYTRAHLKHLFRVGEPLAARLASEHNLRFYARLMEKLRER